MKLYGLINKYLTKLKNFGSDFYVRIGSECTELIFDGRHKVYGSRKNNFPSSKVFLFNVVKNDVLKFIANNPEFYISSKIKNNGESVKPVEYNLRYDNSIGTLTGTELNHAFWRIAYIKNYILKKNL